MSVRPIVTPMPEVVDRYTIAMLKIERLSQDEIDVKDMQRQIDYYKTGIDFSNVELRKLVEALYDINGKMWDAEYAIRKGLDSDLGLEEIGRRALKIRNLNRVRVKVKNDITEEAGQPEFKDCKMNHASS